jgi:hypothetical protein
MAGRGRKSPEALAAALLPGQWPEPPDDLAEPEAAIWTSVTTSLPSDWFSPPNFPLLKLYCQHVHSADLISADITRWRAEIAQADARLSEARARVPPDQKVINREQQLRLQLAKVMRQQLSAHGSQSGHVARLAQKLRLSQKSRYARPDGAAAATARTTSQPWLDWPGGRQ